MVCAACCCVSAYPCYCRSIESVGVCQGVQLHVPTYLAK